MGQQRLPKIGTCKMIATAYNVGMNTIPTLPTWPGWHLVGRFPEGDPDGVGSWLLHDGGEAMLLEVPPGLTARHVYSAMAATGSRRLTYVTASHKHEDHLDVHSWQILRKFFPFAVFFHANLFPTDQKLLQIGKEELYIIKAPKHSKSDSVVVFRGVAMTGDIELGQLESVNDEVHERIKLRSMKWLQDFERRADYHVHSIVSAHLNDVRENVNWRELFEV